MAHPTIIELVKSIQEFKMDKSMPPNKTDVLFLDYKV